MDADDEMTAWDVAADAAADAVDFVYENWDMFRMEARIVGLAVAVLFAAAHGSLQRPPSAAPPEEKTKENKKKKKKQTKQALLERQGLQRMDALWMPLSASASLVGLYALIQYLQDPALLVRVLRCVLAVVGVTSLGRALADALHVAASLVFPRVWARGGQLFRVDPGRRRQWRRRPPGGGGGGAAGDNTATPWTLDTRTTPFPDGLGLAWLAQARPRLAAAAWRLRRLARGAWSVRVAVPGLGVDAELEDALTVPGVLGPVLATVAGVFYVAAAGAWWPSFFNNLLGLGYSYFSLLVVSGTSFAITSLLLAGLFVYDVVMVFYTPFMIKVATTIDAPIKIVAESGDRSGMLGLGDIVLPGVLVCLCLRYDLHRFYARQIRHVAAPPNVAGAATREVKAAYVDAQGRWGDRLWTAAAGAAVLADAVPGLQAARFPKPYFWTAMAAYLVGLLLALVAMTVSGRGQPALLYLVPALLLAVWGRAAATGDLAGLWAYTEDGELDTEQVVVDVDVDANGQVVVVGGAAAAAAGETKTGGTEETKDASKGADADADADGRDVFVLAIRAQDSADEDD